MEAKLRYATLSLNRALYEIGFIYRWRAIALNSHEVDRKWIRGCKNFSNIAVARMWTAFVNLKLSFLVYD